MMGPRLVLLALSALISISHAESSIRRSLNWGPSPAVGTLSADTVNEFVATFNDRSWFHAPPSPEFLAREFLVEKFESEESSWKLTNTYITKLTGVSHNWFVQVGKDGLEIANSNVLVNVDLKTQKIISVKGAESVWTGAFDNQQAHVSAQEASKAACAALEHKLEGLVAKTEKKVEDWFLQDGSSDQVVFQAGAPTSSDVEEAPGSLLSELSRDDIATLANCASPFLSRFGVASMASADSEEQVLDPRLSLISFLSIAHPSLPTEHFTPESFVVSPSLTTEGEYDITLSPSFASASIFQTGGLDQIFSFGPVKSKLVHIIDGDELVKAWSLVVESVDNHYNAFIRAGSPFAQDAAVMVVDWMRDFRPTGGEVIKPVGPSADLESQVLGFQALGMGVVNNKYVWDPSSLVAPTTVMMAVEPQGSQKPLPEKPLPVPKHKGPYYKVFPWSVNDPTEGKRALLARHQKPAYLETSATPQTDLDWDASPVGWHTIVPKSSHVDSQKFSTSEKWEDVPGWLEKINSGSGASFKDTRGNNVFAQDNPSGGYTFENNFRPVGTPAGEHGHEDIVADHPIEELLFDFPLGWKTGGKTLEPSTYINASVTELFYTINEIHDLFWRYGFDEPAGNFQERNFGRGGLENDAVQANAQDGSGTDNANFATPPDGQRGRMRMYVWTSSQPRRDGDLEAGIVMHEFAHGISTRLTGGPANSGCLGWGEAGGMGEGWGDAFATLIRMQSGNETEFGMGDWASGRDGGIRKYRYSRNITVNPETYKVLDGPGYWGVHAIGEVWAEMLFEVGELLIAKHGFSSSLFPPPIAHNASFADPITEEEEGFYYIHPNTGLKVPKHGNSLMIRLIVDGMKLQPCRPSFFAARDAILEADKILTGGENACEIWTGFGKRGLGPDARLVGSTPWGGGVREEDFALPKGICKGEKKKFARWI